MLKFDLVHINCIASASFKYVACWNTTYLQVIQVQTKSKTLLEALNTCYLNFDEQKGIMIYANLKTDFVLYNIYFKTFIKICKSQERIIKTVFLHPEPIMMTLGSKGLFEQYYQGDKLMRQIKGSLWDDERNYDFVYSRRHKQLIIAQKSGQLIFHNGRQPLAEVFIHIPFHSLSLSPNQQYVSAICKNQIFIYEILTQKRSYLQVSYPSSLSWLTEATIAVMKVTFEKKTLSVWDVKEEEEIKQKIVSDYFYKMTGQGENARCLYVTPIEDEEEKGCLVEWFKTEELFESHEQDEFIRNNGEEDKR